MQVVQQQAEKRVARARITGDPNEHGQSPLVWKRSPAEIRRAIHFAKVAVPGAPSPVSPDKGGKMGKEIEMSLVTSVTDGFHGIDRLSRREMFARFFLILALPGP